MNSLIYALVIILGFMIVTTSLVFGCPLIMYGTWMFLEETLGKSIREALEEQE